MICPLYAALPASQQAAVFAPAPPNTRKIILATNVAETSITISGVKYVIDTGMAKLRKLMSKFPIEPSFAKVLIKSKDFGCTAEVISIIAALSVEAIFFSPHNKREEAFEAKTKFINYDGDHVTLLNVMKTYLTMSADKDWCSQNFLNARALKQASVEY
ncbi:putative ATP-dependent RNA helicase dhx33 [Phlyctochytrium planicorne]|nr:putative ATP-dependent RNA helicase dhx33 [Phlyctochytrium planicorne]